MNPDAIPTELDEIQAKRQTAAAFAALSTVFFIWARRGLIGQARIQSQWDAYAASRNA